jgi:hypothetical protein
MSLLESLSCQLLAVDPRVGAHTLSVAGFPLEHTENDCGEDPDATEQSPAQLACVGDLVVDIIITAWFYRRHGNP